MSDEGFHEIQLNGKQLVFLFMAATVVSVVIFLSGVLVGRGVRAQQGGEITADVDAIADPTAGTLLAVSPAVLGTTDGAPRSSQETLTYAERLETPDSPPEVLKESPSPVARSIAASEWNWPETGSERPSAPPAAAAVPAPPTSVAHPSEASAQPDVAGFVVQVAAVNDRREADAMARRLSAKGYPAFVTTPAGAARVFRVRVGSYIDRREAEAIAARLEKEDQFKPWITR
jgi:cell division septation protein DedD